MTTTISEFVIYQQITGVRACSVSNIAGTYNNGPSNNGIGATLTLAASTLTIDGVVIVNDNSVLLTGQTSAFQNGIYLVSGVGSAVVLTRRSDFQEFSQMVPGYYLTVAAGTSLSGSIFTVVEPQVQRVGVDAIVFDNAASNATSATFTNTGLKILNPAGTFSTTIQPTTAITANRTFGFATGDANRTLDISAADVTISAFGATVVDDANAAAARATLGAAASGANTDITSVNLDNTGLQVKNGAGTFSTSIVPSTAISANRVFSIATGDAARTLDISAGDVTVTAYGAGVTGAANALAGITAVGLKRGTTAAYGGGGTSNAYVATGVVATDIVVASILSQTTGTVSLVSVVPGAATITATFSADPGANTVLNWIAIPTV